MTIRDLLNARNISVDVCDDYDERCYIAYESGYKLTTAGIDRFGGALGIPVIRIENGIALLHCETEDEAQECEDLFESLAGLCGYNDFDRWFMEA